MTPDDRQLMLEILRRLELQERVGMHLTAAIDRQARAYEAMLVQLRADRAERDGSDWWKG